MAKPQKKGLDYFPLDTDFLKDQKIQRLMLEFGCEGLSVFIAVLCEVYASQGYYVAIKGGFYPAIGFSVGVDETKVNEIVHRCLELDLFDRGMYEGELILTSRAIQLRYGVICRRMKRWIREEFRLVSDADFNDAEKEGDSINNKIINERIKEREKEIEIEKENKIKKETYHEKNKSNNSNDDATRRAELLRMAEAATRGSRDA